MALKWWAGAAGEEGEGERSVREETAELKGGGSNGKRAERERHGTDGAATLS